MNEKGWKEATFGLEAGPNVVNKQNGQQMLDFNLAFCTKTCACHLQFVSPFFRASESEKFSFAFHFFPVEEITRRDAKNSLHK